MTVSKDVREMLYAAAYKLTEDRLDAGEPFNPHREGVDTVLAHLEQVGWLCEATDDPDRMVVLHNNGAPVPPDTVVSRDGHEAERLYRIRKD